MMIERRQHQRLTIDGWASLKHPLLGTMTGQVEDISAGGLSLRLDGDMNFFVMMELDAHIHSDELDDSIPAMPVQVVRVGYRRIGLKFLEEIEDCVSSHLGKSDVGLSMQEFLDAESYLQPV